MSQPQVKMNPKDLSINVSIENLDDDQVAELRSCLLALLRSSGWKTLQGVVDNQVQLKNMNLLQPLASRDAVLACEHLKGQVAGAIGVLDLPQILLDNLQQPEED